MPIVPPKLRRGDTVRVIAPSMSLAVIGEANRPIADTRFAELGLTVTFGEHVLERDGLDSSSVASRIADLHAAFADPTVNGILTVIGGFNSSSLLPQLDWSLIAANPKVFCGYSDITALQAAMLARADLVTYSGPHWSTFGMQHHLDYTLRAFTDCLFSTEPLDVLPARTWTDDAWYADQDDRHPHPNDGWWVLGEGEAAGRILGGNLSTFTLLHGTPYLPSLNGSIVFIEDDYESKPHHFDRNLVSLLQQPGFADVRGLVIGRFQRDSGMTRSLLEEIVATKPELSLLPVVANVDFGHTNPMITFPIGGEATVTATPEDAAIRIWGTSATGCHGHPWRASNNNPAFGLESP